MQLNVSKVPAINQKTENQHGHNDDMSYRFAEFSDQEHFSNKTMRKGALSSMGDREF